MDIFLEVLGVVVVIAAVGWLLRKLTGGMHTTLTHRLGPKGRRPRWGERSRFTHWESESGYSVWCCEGGSWSVAEEHLAPGFVAGPPPARKGRFEGECLFQNGVRKPR
jgi:hypothetical protein